MQERSKDPLVGTLVGGRYLVESRLARGGMSTVYLATDQRLDRQIALKVLFPHLAEDRGFLHRFEREAKSAAKLSHVHVVGVLDQGIDEAAERTVAYLAMEYVPGRTLRDLLNEKGRLTPRLSLAMMDPVIEGLGAAHEAGLVHRDVKPENVLLARNGSIKIADFGLARAVSSTTSTGTLVGTAAYLPPELVTGGAADARSDIYSAGIMLFELVTGRQPFTGETPIQVAFQHAHSFVPAPSSLLPGLPADIDELVQWCTAADPEARPVDGIALLGELRHIRTTLTDEELDFGLPDMRPEDPEAAAGNRRPGATEVLRTLPSGVTSVIPRDDAATRVISPGRPNDTTVLPKGSGPVPAGSSEPAPEMDPKSRERLARKEFKAYQQEQARAAQRPEKQLRPGRAGRRNAVWIVLLLLLAALAAGAGWFFGSGPGALVAVPEVANRPVEQARALLAGAGLESTPPIQVFDDVIASGMVVRSEPAAPTEVRRFQPVKLIVSRGPELFAVPAVAGRNQVPAIESLVRSGLSVGTVTEEHSETAAKGTVIRTEPAAGQRVREGTAVVLILSLGRRPVDVPLVVGQIRNDAVKAVEAADLTPEVTPDGVNSPDLPEGAVAAQIPSGGQLLPGETVTLTLSLGPRMVGVPDVFARQEEDAVAALEDAGFEVTIDYTFGTAVLGLVAGQDLTGEQPEGSAVTITVT